MFHCGPREEAALVNVNDLFFGVKRAAARVNGETADADHRKFYLPVEGSTVV